MCSSIFSLIFHIVSSDFVVISNFLGDVLITGTVTSSVKSTQNTVE